MEDPPTAAGAADSPQQQVHGMAQQATKPGGGAACSSHDGAAALAAQLKRLVQKANQGALMSSHLFTSDGCGGRGASCVRAGTPRHHDHRGLTAHDACHGV